MCALILLQEKDPTNEQLKKDLDKQNHRLEDLQAQLAVVEVHLHSFAYLSISSKQSGKLKIAPRSHLTNLPQEANRRCLRYNDAVKFETQRRILLRRVLELEALLKESSEQLQSSRARVDGLETQLATVFRSLGLNILRALIEAVLVGYIRNECSMRRFYWPQKRRFRDTKML